MTDIEPRTAQRERERLTDSSVGSMFAELDAHEAMRALCEGVNEVVQSGPQPPVRVHMRVGQASIDVEWPQPEAAPVVAATAPVGAPVVPVVVEPVGITVSAPLVGTFYRCSEPGARPFVEPGDVIVPGQQIGIVEAMKLMNAVVSEVPGRVVEVLVKDGELVEYGQDLVMLEPVAQP
ncbi:MAG TPA: biotin/lipoyl-containing protein [Pseudonocardiaceae bacterium]